MSLGSTLYKTKSINPKNHLTSLVLLLKQFSKEKIKCENVEDDGRVVLQVQTDFGNVS